MPKVWEPPGAGWTTAITNQSWYRKSGDRFVICAVVWPKTIPGWDGGEWTESELWTASVPPDDDNHFYIWNLHDKPHRTSWAKDDPDAEVLSRVSLPAGLVAAHAFDEIVAHSRTRRVHRSAPFEVCLPWRHDWCQRKHRWQALCPCGWKQTRGRHVAAEHELHLHHEYDHGGSDA